MHHNTFIHQSIITLILFKEAKQFIGRNQEHNRFTYSSFVHLAGSMSRTREQSSLHTPHWRSKPFSSTIGVTQSRGRRRRKLVLFAASVHNLWFVTVTDWFSQRMWRRGGKGRWRRCRRRPRIRWPWRDIVRRLLATVTALPEIMKQRHRQDSS